MSRINPYFREQNPGHLMYHCEGCDMPHVVYVGPDKPNQPRWDFNGDYEKPTFSPSVLVHYPHWSPPATEENPNPPNQVRVEGRCHTFIRNGMVEFLSDCSHSLAGQTRPMPLYDGQYEE